jgi:hypothetical protein
MRARIAEKLIHFALINIHLEFYVIHKEIDIVDKKYEIKASLKIPENKKSTSGVILAHGGIINRQSLIRKKFSFGEYLCKELGAYVICADFLGDTVHIDGVDYCNFKEIVNITSKYLVESYDLEVMMGFGHSLGSYVLAESSLKNPYLDSIVNYGGPIIEIIGSRQKSFLDYMVNFFSNYKYKVNVRNLLQYIFDSETYRYLEDVMLKDEDYHYHTYVFDLESQIMSYFKNVVNEYFDLLKKWNKPTLLLFGTEDGVTKRTLNYYKDKPVLDNIIFRQVVGASHITPCMESKHQLSKLKQVVTFFQQIQYNIGRPVLMEKNNTAQVLKN